LYLVFAFLFGVSLQTTHQVSSDVGMRR
jgi:hypothetical protein